MPHIRLDITAIVDWPSVHAECRRALGFPNSCGANMDAWTDCMTSLRDETAGGMPSSASAGRMCFSLNYRTLNDSERDCPKSPGAVGVYSFREPTLY